MGQFYFVKHIHIYDGNSFIVNGTVLLRKTCPQSGYLLSSGKWSLTQPCEYYHENVDMSSTFFQILFSAFVTVRTPLTLHTRSRAALLLLRKLPAMPGTCSLHNRDPAVHVSVHVTHICEQLLVYAAA